MGVRKKGKIGSKWHKNSIFWVSSPKFGHFKAPLPILESCWGMMKTVYDICTVYTGTSLHCAPLYRGVSQEGPLCYTSLKNPSIMITPVTRNRNLRVLFALRPNFRPPCTEIFEKIFQFLGPKFKIFFKNNCFHPFSLIFSAFFAFFAHFSSFSSRPLSFCPPFPDFLISSSVSTKSGRGLRPSLY